MPPVDNIDAIVAESHLTLEDRIRRRAYEIHEHHAGQGHSDVDDWLQAEREILGGENGDTTEDRATVIGHAGRPGVVL